MKRYSPLLALLSIVVVAACEVKKSSDPLSPTVAGPIPGVNITPPKVLEPGTGWQIDTTKQPLMLLLENASSNGPRPLLYTFEVATDADFTNKIFVREGIAQGDGGRTSLRLPDSLQAERSYYWRGKAADGANAGPYSSPADFRVFTPIAIEQPGQIAPTNNVKTSDTHPRFSIQNAARSGPAGPVAYVIEIADSDSFVNKVAIWTVSEQPNQTNLDAPANLSPNTQYFWHARAYDSSVAGPWSATQAFQTPAPPPAPTPPPSGGGGAACGPPYPGAPLGIVQCRRSQYGTPMSSDQHLGFLRGVASDLNAAHIAPGGFGLLRKSGGSNCGGYSCDIICSGSGSGQRQWDVLTDSEGRANPTWQGPSTVPNIRVDTCTIP